MHNFAAKYSLFDFCKIKLNKKMAPVKFHLPVLLMFLPPEIVSPPFSVHPGSLGLTDFHLLTSCSLSSLPGMIHHSYSIYFPAESFHVS